MHLCYVAYHPGVDMVLWACTMLRPISPYYTYHVLRMSTIPVYMVHIFLTPSRHFSDTFTNDDCCVIVA